jgi:hypothetical protein
MNYSELLTGRLPELLNGGTDADVLVGEFEEDSEGDGNADVSAGGEFRYFAPSSLTPAEQAGAALPAGTTAFSGLRMRVTGSKVWWTLRGNVDVQRRRRRDAVTLRCTVDDDEAVWTAWYARLYKAVSVPRPQGTEPLLLLVVARFSGEYVDALSGEPASLGLQRPAQVVRIGAPDEALHEAPLSELDGPIRLLPCFSGGSGTEPDGEEAVLVLPRAAGHAGAMPH